MRVRAEREVWSKARKQRSSSTVAPVSLASGKDLKLSVPCTVLAGLNGAGKTRALRMINDSTPDTTLLIQLHELCEHARASLRSRIDIQDMEEESGAIELDRKMAETLGRIIGRDYEYVQWFSLEFEPNEDYRGSFLWPGGQILVPHFRVKHKGVEYSSLDMGLGEFSVHLLFWVFEIYRDTKNLTVLLDEPDAYLPPVTAERLVSRLIQTANSRDWNLTIATHSESVIELACENDSFVLLRSGDNGIEAYGSQDYGVEIASELLPPRGVSAVIFCEDESAAALTRAILQTHKGWLAASTDVVWKDGDGYLRMLAKHLPRYKGMSISFGLVFDGDQRGKVVDAEPATGWPSLFLPSDASPDALFRSLATDPSSLSSALGAEPHKVGFALDALQGSDDHDWVNGICDRLGTRRFVLDTLADLWVVKNSEEAAEFLKDLQAKLGV